MDEVLIKDNRTDDKITEGFMCAINITDQRIYITLDTGYLISLPKDEIIKKLMLYKLEQSK